VRVLTGYEQGLGQADEAQTLREDEDLVRGGPGPDADGPGADGPGATPRADTTEISDNTKEQLR
jgi:hypothetical protein